MSEKKYQIFISSTYRDLIDERSDIARSVLDLGHIPAAMEYFPAMDEEQLKYIQRVIDQCDYYVLVLAGKYGSVDSSGTSYTEREYNYALEKNKVVLGFPFQDIRNLPRLQTETDPDLIARLEKFRSKVMDGRLVRTWTDRKDLDLKIVKALAAAFQQFPQSGWVRTPDTSSEDLLAEINELRKENQMLTSKINAISSETPKSAEDLADFDDTYSFTLTLTKPLEHLGNVGSANITTVWREIFTNFGRSLSSRKSLSSLRQDVANCYASNIWFGGERVPMGSYGHFRPMDFDIMFAQLVVHGLIEEVKDGEIQLTQKGRNFYLHNITIKKGGKPPMIIER